MTSLRLAFRQLIKTPGFTVTALATLALCLGANLAIFAVIDAILLRPLPFPDSERLVTLINAYPKAGVERSGTSVPNYFDRRGAIDALASFSLIRNDSITVGEAGAPERAQIDRVTPEFFATLGVSPALGRSFTDAELTYQTDQVAVLTDSYWRTHFQADPAVLGKTFFNDGIPITVVGVLPRDFRFLSSRAQFFRPLSHDPKDRQPDSRHNNTATMVARLAPGRTLAEAQGQLDGLNAGLLATDPFLAKTRDSGYRTNIYPLHADHVREIRPTLTLLQCGVLLLLLIGAVNLANLSLIRASSRVKELAVRQALGAGRRHIARDVLVETMVMALAGGTLGLLLGAFGVQLLATLGTDQLPLGATIAFDTRVAVLSLFATIVFGGLLAAPIIWFNLHVKLAPGLQAETRGGTASRAAQRLRHGFIVAQVALAFLLLSGAGLLGVSLKNVLAAPVGFQPETMLSGRIALPWKNYRDNAARLAFVERLVPAIRELPGVTRAAISFDPPFTDGGFNGVVAVDGYVSPAGGAARPHHFSAVTSDFWTAAGIPLVRGRFFEDADNHRETRVCVVDEDVARYYWGDRDPLGGRLSLGFAFDPDNSATVVGVVAPVKQNDLAEDAGHGAIYFNYGFFSMNNFSLAVQTALRPASLAPAVRKAILQLDPELPIDDLRPMTQRIDDSLVTRRSPAILAAVFAGVALLLATIGTYGVLAYAVSHRRREIGIRMALGALPREILAQFLGVGVRLLAIGVALGIPAAWLAGHFMRSMLYGVSTLHTGVLGLSAATMGVVVLFACLLPSRRAARVNPIEALRDE